MNTNNFFGRCCIKKNTMALREKLFKMGYVATSPLDGWNIVCENGTFQTGRILFGKELITFTNCVLNEKLFLYTAALRYNSDYGQLFVAHKLIIFSTTSLQCVFPGDLFLCECNNVSAMKTLSIRLPGEDNVKWHKATESELVKILS